MTSRQVRRADERRAKKLASRKYPVKAQKAKELPPIRLNKRDRSEAADAKRAEHITMDFTDGVAGISRALVNHTPPTLHQRKPKRGSAAKMRRAPFREFFAGNPEKLEQARMRHPWYRKKKAMDALRQLLAAE